MLHRPIKCCNVARIGQRIAADDPILRMFTQFMVNKVRSNKSGTARDNDLHNFCSFSLCLR